MRKENLKYYLYLVAFTICLYLGLAHFSVLVNIFRTTLRILAPFIVGIAFAFVLNGPTNWFEKFILKYKRPIIQKNARFLAVTITLIITGLSLLFIFFGLIPQLAESTNTLISNLPGYFNALHSLFDSLMVKFDVSTETIQKVNVAFKSFTKSVTSNLDSLAPTVASTVSSVITNVVNVFIGGVVAVQLLFDTEKLMRQLRRLFSALLPQKQLRILLHISNTTIKIFRNYIYVQFMSGVIVGVISVLALYIFNFPYATLVAVFMGVTSMIPVFGSFIGMIPSFFIIVMANPVKGFWYIILALAVQQIVGNFITPNLVIGKLGLPGLLIMVSVSVGGATMGPLGLIIGTPIFAVFYALLKEWVEIREKKKKLAIPVPSSPRPPE